MTHAKIFALHQYEDMEKVLEDVKEAEAQCYDTFDDNFNMIQFRDESHLLLDRRTMLLVPLE